MAELVALKDKANSIKALLESKKGELAAALPKHITAERMIRVAFTSILRTPALLDCTRESLIGAIVTSSQLGLEPDGVTGQAYLIPYGKVCTFIPGYRGLLALAWRSGQLASISVEVVHEKDKFRHEKGTSERIEHLPYDGAEDPGKATHAYCILTIKGGGKIPVVMSVAQIEKVRSQSRAGKSGPWVSHWEEMAKKTVIRRALKLAPMSVEVQRAITLDEEAEAGLPQALDIPEPMEAEVVGITEAREPGQEG